ncbi:MAG: hypothetical protein LBR18_00555 [Tannerella sp.]|jgi:hypothetical protein|nr:hypothetical protein [Tannerella sp.]
MDHFELEINDRLAEILKKAVPERGKLTNLLCEQLEIEKVAIYRRLRNDIPFTFAEVVKIAKWLGISLDSIVGESNPYRSQAFQLYWQDFFNLNEKDEKMSNDYIAAIILAAHNPYSEFGIAVNGLPLHVTVQFPTIFRFYVLKWMYQFGKPGELIKYSDVVLPEFLLDIHRRYRAAVLQVGYTYFISDETAFQKLINDIHYFKSIHLITDDEIAQLKDDFTEMFSRIEAIAIKGAYPNGNEVEIYTSGVSFETTYTYLYSESVYVSMIGVFTTGSMSSVDPQSCNHMRSWLRALKRTATPITGNEKNRIQYIEKQLKVLNTL